MSKDILLKKYGFVIILSLIIIAALIWSLGTAVSPPAGGSIPQVNSFTIAMLILLGLGAGFFGGLLGVGGGLIMLPILSFGMGFPLTIAVGTTLFAVIFTTISGGYAHLIHGNAHTRSSMFLALGGVAGIILGSYVFAILTSQMKILSLLLGIFFFLPSVYMIGDALFNRRQIGNVHNAADKVKGTPLTFFGFIVGFLTGILGLGGGFLLVPGLTYIFAFPIQLAVGTSLVAIIPVTILGGGIKLLQSFVLLPSALALGLGTIFGAQLGAVSIKYFKASTLKLIFGVYFLYVALRYIIGFWK